MMKRSKSGFTRLELWAIYYSLYQPHLIEGKYKAALRRAASKAEWKARAARQREIYAAAYKIGRANLEYAGVPVFEGRKLGSLESVGWHLGWEKGKRDYSIRRKRAIITPRRVA